MPRSILEPRFQVEHLSILDGDGNLDAALEPKIDADQLRRIYRAMLLGRRLDERMVRLQRQGRIGTFAPIKGQEAAQIGSVVALRPSDWMVPYFRETAAMLWRGWPIEKLLSFFAGYLEGGQPARDQHDLPITIPVSTQLPHAVGLAYAAQYRGDDVAVANDRLFAGARHPEDGDLRIIDDGNGASAAEGADGARFASDIVRRLERPEELLLEI
jgi:pyruvate dehydrogenase E1 component alpha subunit